MRAGAEDVLVAGGAGVVAVRRVPGIGFVPGVDRAGDGHADSQVDVSDRFGRFEVPVPEDVLVRAPESQRPVDRDPLPGTPARAARDHVERARIRLPRFVLSDGGTPLNTTIGTSPWLTTSYSMVT